MNNDIKADNRTFKLTPLIISLAVLLSPLISLFIAPNVGATTTYDGVFNDLPTTLKIERKQDSCPAVDITNTWGGMITDPSKWLGSATGDKTGAIAAFNIAKNNGTGWAASQVVSNGNIGSVMTSPDLLNNDTKYQMAGTTFVFITYTPDASNYVDFISYDTVRMAYMSSSDGVLPTYNLMIFQDNLCNPVVYGVTQKSYIAYGNQVVAVQLLADAGIWSSGTAKPLFVNSTIRYPAFYAGAIPPSSMIAPIVVRDIFPILSARLDKQRLSMTTIPKTGDLTPNGITYSVWNSDNTEELFSYHFIGSEINTFIYDFAATGDYHIHAVYDIPFPIDPATYNNIMTDWSITVDGSSQSILLPNENECTIGGTVTCAPATLPLLKDCSVFGPDIIGGFGCHLTNFGIVLVHDLSDLVSFLFVPDTSVIASSFNSMYSMVETKLGFLLYPFSFVFRFFQSILDISGPVLCTIDLDKVYGVQYNLDICSFERNLPTFFFFAQSLLQGVTSMGLMWQIRKKFDEVMIR